MRVKAERNLAAIYEKGVFTVTKEGIVLPKGVNVPSNFVKNPFRSSNYGGMVNLLKS